MSERSIRDTYLEMLKAYATQPDEELLAKFEDLGPRLVTDGVAPEEIAQIHDESSRRLFAESPTLILPDTITQIFPALQRVLKAYGAAFQQHIEQDRQRCQKQAERKFRKIFDQSGDGIVIVDTEGKILDVNRKAQNLWGYVRAEMLTLTHSDLYAPQVAESCLSLFYTHFEAQAQQPDSHNLTLDVECVRKDRSLFYGEFSGGGMEFEGRSCFVGVVRDITVRKQALEERVRLQEELADEISVTLGIVDTAADGIITIDEQGRIESYNKAARSMFGYEEYDVLGKNVSLLMPSPHREEADGFLLRYGQTGEQHLIGKSRELLGLRKDGTTFPLELAVSEVQLGDRTVFTGITRDITERKQAEAEREALHKELQDASRMAGMADVASGVLHNVGNILTSVSVSAGLIRKLATQSSVEKLQRTAAMLQDHRSDVGEFLKHDPKGKIIPEYLTNLGDHLSQEQDALLKEAQELTTNIEHINQVIQMQQTLAKPSRGLEEPVALHDLMEQALYINIASLYRHQVEIVREFGEVPQVFVDRHQALQILVNLISNAKYAVMARPEGAGQVTLMVGVVDGQEGMVQLQVKDNGIGINSEHLTKIFSQGFTTKKEGHGFGLHSAVLSAKNMGGLLTVHSDGEGHGATFTLELPVKPVEGVADRSSLVGSGE